MAREADTQAEAKAQPWAVEGSAPKMLVMGGVGDAGISHSCSAPGFAARRHAAVPSTGWNWKRSRRAANSLMARTVPLRRTILKRISKRAVLTLHLGTGSHIVVHEKEVSRMMRIGQVAAEARVNIQTLRYYERRGGCQNLSGVARGTAPTIPTPLSSFGSSSGRRSLDSRSERVAGDVATAGGTQ
jgi:MerR HTH family regulatory protein